MNNRVTAQGYSAWDNIFSGNGYNLRLWLAGFKTRLREALTAQIRAIVAREGMLLHQAVRGFTLWFRRTPEVTPELRALIEADLAPPPDNAAHANAAKQAEH